MVVPFFGVGVVESWRVRCVSGADGVDRQPLPDVAHDRPALSRAVIVSAGSPPLRLCVEAVARSQIPSVNGFALDGRCVERGDELHRRTGAGQRGVVAAAGEHVVDQPIDLGGVVAGQIRPGGGGPDVVAAGRLRDVRPRRRLGRPGSRPRLAAVVASGAGVQDQSASR